MCVCVYVCVLCSLPNVPHTPLAFSKGIFLFSRAQTHTHTHAQGAREATRRVVQRPRRISRSMHTDAHIHAYTHIYAHKYMSSHDLHTGRTSTHTQRDKRLFSIASFCLSPSLQNGLRFFRILSAFSLSHTQIVHRTSYLTTQLLPHIHYPLSLMQPSHKQTSASLRPPQTLRRANPHTHTQASVHLFRALPIPLVHFLSLPLSQLRRHPRLTAPTAPHSPSLTSPFPAYSARSRRTCRTIPLSAAAIAHICSGAPAFARKTTAPEPQERACVSVCACTCVCVGSCLCACFLFSCCRG